MNDIMLWKYIIDFFLRTILTAIHSGKILVYLKINYSDKSAKFLSVIIIFLDTLD